jgi:hypothetical protein
MVSQPCHTRGPDHTSGSLVDLPMEMGQQSDIEAEVTTPLVTPEVNQIPLACDHPAIAAQRPLAGCPPPPGVHRVEGS